MKKDNLLPFGRRHELESTGITQIGRPEKVPYKGFNQSLEEILNSRLKIEAKDDVPERVYNPADPKWGKMPILFASVKRYLPKRPGLFLYNAIGSSLDLLHGVDLFFFWNGVYATIDLSLADSLKELRGTVDLRQNLEDMTEEDFDVFGQQIAGILRKRKELKKQNKKKSKNLFIGPD